MTGPNGIERRKPSECSRETCVYHDGNMDTFDKFEASLKELSAAINSLDKDIVKVNTGTKVRVSIMAVAVTLIIGTFAFQQGQITTTNVTVAAGMQKRVILETELISMKDDIAEIKQLLKADHETVFNGFGYHIDKRKQK